MANQTLSSRLNVGVANIVVPGTSSGLVSASGLTGNTTGSAIATGFVGQVVVTTFGSAGTTNSTISNIGGWTAPAGIWLCQGFGTYSPTSTTGATFWQLGLSTTTASLSQPFTQFNSESTGGNLSVIATVTPNLVFVATGSNTLFLCQQCNFSGGSIIIQNGQIYAIRIA